MFSVLDSDFNYGRFVMNGLEVYNVEDEHISNTIVPIIADHGQPVDVSGRDTHEGIGGVAPGDVASATPGDISGDAVIDLSNEHNDENIVSAAGGDP